MYTDWGAHGTDPGLLTPSSPLLCTLEALVMSAWHGSPRAGDVSARCGELRRVELGITA